MKQPMIQNQHGIRTAAYCRLSKDDEQIGESASIQTQRDMILYHIRQNGWSLVDVYIDDGYTGLNTNRPSFQRMLRDIEAGKIDIVVTKDLSRLGRNYVQTGFYIEEYFPKNHVRYIALNDSVDTTLDNNDIAPFKNILNEFYSRDVSKKIRSARQIKAHQGVFSASYAPLGYKKDPDQHGHLIVDEETAWIVRKIFAWAKEGWGAQRIKTQLGKEHIPTPTWWNRERGLRNYYGRFEQDDGSDIYTWNLTTIKKILTQPAYIGAVANQKNVTKFKIGWMGYRPMDEWVIVEGMHEPIIDRQTWDIVQEKINSRKRPDGNGNFSIFSGLVHCADCGKTLTVRYNSQRRKLFSCLTYNRYGKSHCTSHSIFYDQLYDAVLKDIQDCAALALADENAAVAALCEKFSQSGTDFMVSAKLSAAEKRKQELDTMMDRLYQDWMGGRLNENNFNRMLTNTQSEQETLDQQIAEYREMLSETSEKQVNIQHWVEMVRRYAGIQELDAQVLNELVSNIVVHNPELIDGELVQNVDIHYTFEVETNLMVSRPKKAS